MKSDNKENEKLLKPFRITSFIGMINPTVSSYLEKLVSEDRIRGVSVKSSLLLFRIIECTIKEFYDGDVNNWGKCTGEFSAKLLAQFACEFSLSFTPIPKLASSLMCLAVKEGMHIYINNSTLDWNESSQRIYKEFLLKTFEEILPYLSGEMFGFYRIAFVDAILTHLLSKIDIAEPVTEMHISFSNSDAEPLNDTYPEPFINKTNDYDIDSKALLIYSDGMDKPVCGETLDIGHTGMMC